VRDHRLDVLDALGKALVEHREEQLLLALEVGVERALREARVLRHLVDRRLLQATTREHACGRVHQALARVRLLLLAREPAHQPVTSEYLKDTPAAGLRAILANDRSGLCAAGLSARAADLAATGSGTVLSQ